jgi:DNA replication protein DnaC
MDYKMIQITDYQGSDLLTMTNLLNIDVIVWDEIGPTNLSQYEYATLLSILDQRCLRGKSNIFTSNLSIQKLEDKLGNRIMSRMSNDLKVIELRGFDRRRGGSV